MSKRILVAEDDSNIRQGLVDTLESEGYRVEAAIDGKQALRLFKQESFDLALLDIMMPEMDGYSLCQEIRKRNDSMAIILVTAKDQEIDKVLGLKLGADDYVTKPFGIHELLARIEANLRRSAKNLGKTSNVDSLPEKFRFGELSVDRSNYEILLVNKTASITARELKLLETFARNIDKALSRNELLDTVWGIEYYGTTRTLDQHIAQLRKKIQGLGGADYIETVHGVGYRYRSQ